MFTWTNSVPDFVTYYSGHPLLSHLEDGRLRAVGAELVFFSKDLNKKFFSIPLNSIKKIRILKQVDGIKSPDISRWFDQAGGSESVMFGTNDGIAIKYINNNRGLEELYFTSKLREAETLKLMIENAVSQIQGGSAPFRNMWGGLIMDWLNQNRGPEYHSFDQFQLPWQTKIVLVLLVALAVTAFLLYLQPR